MFIVVVEIILFTANRGGWGSIIRNSAVRSGATLRGHDDGVVGGGFFLYE
jgi:hypothetical protein